MCISLYHFYQILNSTKSLWMTDHGTGWINHALQVFRVDSFSTCIVQHLDLRWIVTLVYMFQSCWWKTHPGTCCFHWRGNICRNFCTSISQCSGLLNTLLSESVVGNCHMRILIRQSIIEVACGWGLGFSPILMKAFRLTFQNEWRMVHPFGWFYWIFFSSLVSLLLVKSSITWLLKRKYCPKYLDSDKIVFEWLLCCV